MTQPTLFSGNLTAETFLRDYWQKKPLLLRGAFPNFTSPLTPTDLADLACREDADARLILEQGGDYPWELLYGPFDPDDFKALPPTHWTLLVQEVDRLVPTVADLLRAFRFIPNWRIDDVMISYAPQHGGVGAHIDNYDVFLLQGLGHRRWQINHTPVQEERLVPDLDVSMLADFEADADWVLAPGDLLYLPPRIAHYGIALDDCMTYSIGFRAPGTVELAAAFLENILETLDADLRYADPDLSPTNQPGEISPEALARIRKTLRDLLKDDAMLDRWFGQFVTTPKRGHDAPLPETATTAADLWEAIQDGAILRPVAIAQVAFTQHDEGRTTLFASGDAYQLEPSLAFAAPLLTGTSPLDAQTLAPHTTNPAFLNLLAELVENGAFVLTDGS